LEENNGQTNESQAAGEMSKHEKRELKQQQKEEEKEKHEDIKRKKELKSKTIKYTIIGVIVILAVFGMYKAINNIRSFQPYYEGFFHWHANFDVYVCGEKQEIRCPGGMCGIMLTHHHNDDIIHTEGNLIAKKEDVSLGKFFDRIGIPFTETQLMDKKNGDMCNENSGKVKLIVNGKENNELRDYIPSRCDAKDTAEIRQRCDKIEVRFE